jgi:hypothetical protein
VNNLNDRNSASDAEKVRELTDKYLDEKRKVEDLQAKFEKLRLELEGLRSVSPIHDLLMAKQAEVDRMKKALGTVPRGHPDRQAIESMVKAHIVERDALREMLQVAQARFENLKDQISEALAPESKVNGTKKGSRRKSSPSIPAPEF